MPCVEGERAPPEFPFICFLRVFLKALFTGRAAPRSATRRAPAACAVLFSRLILGSAAGHFAGPLRRKARKARLIKALSVLKKEARQRGSQVKRPGYSTHAAPL